MRRRTGSARGWTAAAVTVVLWSAFALVVPLTLSFWPDELPSSSVAAAPGDQVALTAPIAIDAHVNAVSAERGVVALGSEQGTQDRRLLRNNLAAGQGALIADGVHFRIGRSQFDVVPGRAQVGDPAVLKAFSTGSFESLTARRSILTVAISESRDVEVTNVTLEFVRRRKGPFSFKGTGDIFGLRHSFEGSIGSADKRLAAQPPVKIAIAGPLLTASFDGHAPENGGATLVGTLDASLPVGPRGPMSLEGLAKSLTAGGGVSGAEIRITGGVEWSPKALAFQTATVRYLGQEAKGALHLAFGPVRTKVSGTLAAKSIDITGLAKADTTRGALPSTLEALLGRAVSWYPSRDGGSALGEVDADIRLSTGRIIGVPLEAGAAAFTIYKQDDKFNATISELGLAGGRANGNLAVDLGQSPPLSTLRAKIDNIDIETIASITGGGPLLQGTSSLTVDVRALGSSLDEVTRSLDGSLTVVQRAGGRLGIDVKGLLQITQRNFAVGWPAVRGSTSYDQLDAKLIMRGGSVTFENVLLRAGDSVMSAQGGFGVTGGRLFIDLASSSPALVGQAARSGPVDATPAVEPDVLEIRGTFAVPEARRKSVPRAADPAVPQGKAAGTRGPG